MNAGDVVKATHVFYNGAKEDGYFPDEYLPMWGIITDNQDAKYPLVHMLTPPPPIKKDYYHPPEITLGPQDDFDWVPPEKWPDEICTAVARFKLTGEV